MKLASELRSFLRGAKLRGADLARVVRDRCDWDLGPRLLNVETDIRNFPVMSFIPAVLPPFLSDLIILAGFIAATAVKHGDEALSKHHH